MRITTTDNSELMEITAIDTVDGKVVVTGTIMGAMPVRAVVSGTDLRRGWSLLGLRRALTLLRIFLGGKGA